MPRIKDQVNMVGESASGNLAVTVRIPNEHSCQLDSNGKSGPNSVRNSSIVLLKLVGVTGVSTNAVVHIATPERAVSGMEFGAPDPHRRRNLSTQPRSRSEFPPSICMPRVMKERPRRDP